MLHRAFHQRLCAVFAQEGTKVQATHSCSVDLSKAKKIYYSNNNNNNNNNYYYYYLLFLFSYVACVQVLGVTPCVAFDNANGHVPSKASHLRHQIRCLFIGTSTVHRVHDDYHVRIVVAMRIDDAQVSLHHVQFDFFAGAATKKLKLIVLLIFEGKLG